MRSAASRSRISALPASAPATRRAGQPILMSMRSAPSAFEPPRGLGHRGGLAADELHGADRPGDVRARQHSRRPANNPVDGDHFGEGERRAAALRGARIACVGHAGHRREQRFARDRHASNFETRHSDNAYFLSINCDAYTLIIYGMKASRSAANQQVSLALREKAKAKLASRRRLRYDAARFAVGG